DQRLDDPRLGTVLPRPRRETARSGMGPDAQYVAHRDLYATDDRGTAGRDDLCDLDLVQSVLRRPALGHGSQAMTVIPTSEHADSAEMSADPRDRGGPATLLLSVRGLIKHFGHKGGLLSQGSGRVRAVDGVDFDVVKGETLGIVGES